MREAGVKCVAGLILSSYFLAKLRILNSWISFTPHFLYLPAQHNSLGLKVGDFGFRGSVKRILYKYKRPVDTTLLGVRLTFIRTSLSKPLLTSFRSVHETNMPNKSINRSQRLHTILLSILFLHALMTV